LHKYNGSSDYPDRSNGEPMTPFHLSDQEREELQRLLSEGAHAREQRRLQALLWLAAGEPPDHIAEVLGVSRRTIYYWAQRFHDRGDLDLQARLADATRPGRPRTASGIIDPLIAEVIDRDPRDLGYRHTGWTNALLRRYLNEAHGLAVSRRSVRRALARLGIRWKRPRHHLARRPDTWRQSKGGSNAGSKGAPALSW
jgi:transposase